MSEHGGPSCVQVSVWERIFPCMKCPWQGLRPRCRPSCALPLTELAFHLRGFTAGVFYTRVYFPASPRWGLSLRAALRVLLLGFSLVPVGPAERDPPQGAGASTGGDGVAELPAGRPPPRPPSILPPSLGGVFGRERGGGSRAGAASRQFA